MTEPRSQSCQRKWLSWLKKRKKEDKATMSCILCFSRSLKNRITILSIYSFLSRTRTLSRGVVDFAQWRYPSMTLLHLESKTNRDVCVVVLAPTIDKQTKQLGIETKADRTRSQNGLAGVDDHAEQKKRQKEGGNKKKQKQDRPGLARQAGKQACSPSELEGRPPTSALTPPGRRGENVTHQCGVLLWYPLHPTFDGCQG